jgi:secreted trypsin-like serine protease
MGFLYKLDWVITAGHCLPDTASNYAVKAGMIDVDSAAAEDRLASKIIRHPDYNPSNYHNDIGLIQLSTPFPSTSLIKTIPISLAEPVDGEVFITAGFGLTVSGDLSSIPRHNLKWVQLPFVNSQNCANTGVSVNLDPELMICAGGSSNADTCNGDSGSALIRTSNPNNPLDAQVVGLTSYGTEVCASGAPGVYTRIARFYNSFILPNAVTTSPVVPPTSNVLKARACQRNKNKNKPCRLGQGGVGHCKRKKCRA